MARDEIAVTCSDIKNRVKLFLEDMLSEQEYQAFAGHIEGCPSCKTHVRTFGTLSNQLWRLGDVVVPSDFVSTVLFDLQHHPSAAAQVKPAKPRKFVIGVILVIVAAGALFASGKYTAKQKAPEVRQAPVTAAEGEAYIQELNQIKEALGPAQSSAVQQEGQGSPEVLDWHVTYASPEQAQQLTEIIYSKATVIKHESGGLIIFSVPGIAVGTLKKDIRAAGAGISETGPAVSENSFLDSASVNIAVFLQKGES